MAEKTGLNRLCAREGYHDTHDRMENIDLDCGSAVTAIAIESVTRAANEKTPA